MALGAEMDEHKTAREALEQIVKKDKILSQNKICDGPCASIARVALHPQGEEQ